ncbi:conjugal transfer protein, partial [Streptomyces sp. NPDC004059]
PQHHDPAPAPEHPKPPRYQQLYPPKAESSTRPRRTAEQLLTEARTVTADLPDAKVTAEGIRRVLHVSPVNARKLRDALLAERAA